MRNGDYIYAKTHAEFLNKVFGTNYKGWGKCVWKYNDDAIVWMVRFNKVNNGWRNSFVSDNRIKEENLLRQSEWDGKPVDEPLSCKRVVIEIDENGVYRRYIFRGVYRYDKETSNPLTVRYHDKISDEFQPAPKRVQI